MAKKRKPRKKKNKPQQRNKYLDTLREAAYLGVPEALIGLGLCYITGDGVTYNPKRAFDYFAEAAKSGNPEALYHLGMSYFNGEGCQRDLDKAKDYLTKSASLGLPEAKEALAHVETEAAYQKKDKDNFQKNLKKAENGDEDDQALIGGCYIYGLGTTRDIAKGLKILKELVQKENKEAIFYLSDMYNDEQGPLYDVDKAQELNQLGAKLGISECIHNLGANYINSGEFDKGLPFLQQAAQKDNPVSNFMLAYYYHDGQYIKEDKDLTFKYLKRAMELKYEDAYELNDQLLLTDYFNEEQRIELARAALSRGEYGDYLLLALLLFTKKEGQQEALHILQTLSDENDSADGSIYNTLKNHPDDPEKAIIENAEKGDDKDALLIGIFYYQGYILSKDKQKAAHWMQIAAERGNLLAQGVLGDMYLTGTGVQKDEAKGIAMLKDAANKNDRHAINVLEAAYRTGTGVPVSKKKADYYARKAQRLDQNQYNFLYNGLPFGNSIG